ncbi:MAG: hypothetical protein IPK58_04825 [Acidobacteria bacterium]|nr:hypothetical protein [Acidobacteriota bacterium]
MKRWKKILLILLAIVVVAQIPFIFRRFQIANRSALIDSQNSQRIARQDPDFVEFKGIIHAHTSLGGHSTGSFDELIEAASANKLDFVVMTEHTSADYDTSALSLNGIYKNVLFIGGHEADTISGDRFLMINGGPEMFADARLETPAFLEKYHSQGKAALVTYPEKFKSWDSNFDGIEVFSLHTNAKQNTRILTILDMLWSFPSYPGLTLAENFKRPDDNLRKFDEIAAKRKISLFAGTDAHSNIGFHFLGDDAGNKLINFRIDRYQNTFGIVRAHILVERGKELTKESVIDAFKSGRLFVGFDIAGDTSGFSFTAESGGKMFRMGSEVPFAGGMILKSASPLAARFVVLRNGVKVYQTPPQTEMAFDVKESGVYRVEVFRDDLGSAFETMPWIMSNPIYVR